MFKISIQGPRNDNGNPIVEVTVPVLPMKDTYVSHENRTINGYVKDLEFWWDEKDELRITVFLK